jgi:hypothetical protein
MSLASSHQYSDVLEKSRSDPCQDKSTLINDLKPEVDEIVLMHDLGARLSCLVNGFNQVGDLNAYRISRNVIVKVHVEEVAGHRRAPRRMNKHSARRREGRLSAGFGRR